MGSQTPYKPNLKVGAIISDGKRKVLIINLDKELMDYLHKHYRIVHDNDGSISVYRK